MALQNLMVCCDCHLYPLDACVLCVCVCVCVCVVCVCVVCVCVCVCVCAKECSEFELLRPQQDKAAEKQVRVYVCVCVICAWDCDTASPSFHRIWTLPEASVLQVLLQLASRCVSRCLVCTFLQILSRIVRLHLDSVFSPWQKERCHMSVPL